MEISFGSTQTESVGELTLTGNEKQQPRVSTVRTVAPTAGVIALAKKHVPPETDDNSQQLTEIEHCGKETLSNIPAEYRHTEATSAAPDQVLISPTRQLESYTTDLANRSMEVLEPPSPPFVNHTRPATARTVPGNVLV